MDCRPIVDARECRACLLNNPFSGSCAVRGNDPGCEAAKVAANASNAIAKARCEASKTSAKADCDLQKGTCVAAFQLCQTLRSAEIEDAAPLVERLTRLVAQADALPSLPLSKDFVPEGFRIAGGKNIGVSTVNEEQFDAIRWGPFEKPQNALPHSLATFSIGERLIHLENAPQLRVEIVRSLLWIIQFEKLGIDGLAQVIRHAPGALDKIVNQDVEKACGKLACN